jgi:2-dehydropantoate 2-reductase
MKIVVIGIGGVGGYFGGKLALTHHEVIFVARGKHAEAIKEYGLNVKSIYGDFVAKPNLVTDHIGVVENADLVILGVKSWQIEQIALEMKHHLSEHTLVLPLQNGADNADRLLTILPAKNVIGGVSRIIAMKTAAGCIHHKAFHPHITFGAINNKNDTALLNIKSAFEEAGFDHKLSDDIQVAIWTKFLFITTISAIGALTRATMGEMRSNPFIFNMMKKTAAEVLAVAQAKHIGISTKTIEKAFEAIKNQDPDTTASMQRDLMEGRPSELDNFNGYIVKEAKRLGVPTPVNDMIYYCLLPQEKKTRKALNL